MALERYVRMREAYEKEQQAKEGRKEPELGESLTKGLGDVLEEGGNTGHQPPQVSQGEPEPREKVVLSTPQKVMVGVSVLVAVVASVLVYKMPALVMAEFFNFGIRAPIRMMEMLQWNGVLVLLPFLFLGLSFLYNFRRSYLGIRMLIVAIASGVLVIAISGIFSYFVITVGA